MFAEQDDVAISVQCAFHVIRQKDNKKRRNDWTIGGMYRNRNLPHSSCPPCTEIIFNKGNIGKCSH